MNKYGPALSHSPVDLLFAVPSLFASTLVLNNFQWQSSFWLVSEGWCWQRRALIGDWNGAEATR